MTKTISASPAGAAPSDRLRADRRLPLVVPGAKLARGY